MPVIRIKFSKEGNLSYISHLSLMKVFERGIRRANIPIVYSQGFNPHPKMVFSAPLSLGISSESEYADFEVEEGFTAKEFSERLSEKLPEGMGILDAKILEDGDTNIMRATVAATYEILVSGNSDISTLKEEIEKIKDKDEILVQKKSKSKVSEKEIRHMIKELDIYSMTDDNVSEYIKKECVENRKEGLSYYCIIANISAGNDENLNCELLFNTINENMNLNLEEMHRKEMYINKNGETVKAIC